MRCLLTGMKGTVAPVVATELHSLWYEVGVWDRATMSYGTREEVAPTIQACAPDAVMHFGMGPTDWTE